MFNGNGIILDLIMWCLLLIKIRLIKVCEVLDIWVGFFISCVKLKVCEKLRSSCLFFLGNFELGIMFVFRFFKMIIFDFLRLIVGILFCRDEIKVWRLVFGVL